MDNDYYPLTENYHLRKCEKCHSIQGKTMYGEWRSIDNVEFTRRLHPNYRITTAKDRPE
jgi:hypothetical protein